VRIPAFITVAATFVTALAYLIKAYAPALDLALGIFIPLIVVNCIVLGRAEAFASKNPPLAALADGFSMGLGYLAALVLLGSVREFLATGGILGGSPLAWHLPGLEDGFIRAFGLAPGSFIALGLLLALFNALKRRRAAPGGKP
jgi:electron transport complex protein RnfE